MDAKNEGKCVRSICFDSLTNGELGERCGCICVEGSGNRNCRRKGGEGYRELREGERIIYSGEKGDAYTPGGCPGEEDEI